MVLTHLLTSGGLPLACDAGSVAAVPAEFAAGGFDPAHVTGELCAGPARLRTV